MRKEFYVEYTFYDEGWLKFYQSFKVENINFKI